MRNLEIENKRTQEEPPYKRRSPLWRHQKEIKELIRAGYSYRQIRERLDLKVTISRIATFARELGIASRQVWEQPEGKTGRRSEEKTAGQGGEGERQEQSPGPRDTDELKGLEGLKF